MKTLLSVGFIILSISCLAQNTIKAKYDTKTLKTNILHLPFLGIPQLAFENQIGKKQSLQINAYRMKVNFISTSKYAGGALFYRKYFNKTGKISGLYIAPGLNLHYEDFAYNNNGTYGTRYYGLRTDGGYQYLSPKSKFVFDAGFGLFTKLLQSPSPASNYVEVEYRLNLSLGLMLN